jgi:hypothetical protein
MNEIRQITETGLCETMETLVQQCFRHNVDFLKFRHHLDRLEIAFDLMSSLQNDAVDKVFKKRAAVNAFCSKHSVSYADFPDAHWQTMFAIEYPDLDGGQS